MPPEVSQRFLGTTDLGGAAFVIATPGRTGCRVPCRAQARGCHWLGAIPYAGTERGGSTAANQFGRGGPPAWQRYHSLPKRMVDGLARRSTTHSDHDSLSPRLATSLSTCRKTADFFIFLQYFLQYCSQTVSLTSLVSRCCAILFREHERAPTPPQAAERNAE